MYLVENMCGDNYIFKYYPFLFMEYCNLHINCHITDGASAQIMDFSGD